MIPVQAMVIMLPVPFSVLPQLTITAGSGASMEDGANDLLDITSAFRFLLQDQCVFRSMMPGSYLEKRIIWEDQMPKYPEKRYVTATTRRNSVPAPNPNISKAIISAVTGQLVTPQNTAAAPRAEQSGEGSPQTCANRFPKAAPVNSDGTISPP